MKKAKKYLLFTVILTLLLLLFPVTALAEGESDGLIDKYGELIPDGLGIPTEPEELVSALGPDALLNELFSAFRGVAGRAVSFFFLLFGVSVLLSLSSGVTGELAPVIRAAASAVAALLIFMRLLPLVSEVSDTLSALSVFFSGAAPIMLTALSMSGGALSSASAATGVAVTLELSSYITRGFLFTLTFAMFFSGLAASFGGGLCTVARGVRSAFAKGVGIVSALLLGLLSLQTLIGAAKDNLALRAARYASTSTLPIVGSTVAGALSTLVGGLSYARGIIGGSAILVISLLALTPLVMLLLYKLAFFLAISFLEFSSANEGVSCLSALRDALDALIAVYIFSAVVYILETVLLLKVEVVF